MGFNTTINYSLPMLMSQKRLDHVVETTSNHNLENVDGIYTRRKYVLADFIVPCSSNKKWLQSIAYMFYKKAPQDDARVVIVCVGDL